MAGLQDFRARQMDLQRRLGRQRPRTVYRRRLERELRGLIATELELELRPAAPQPMPEDQNVTPPAHWMRRWENQQDSDQ